MKVLIVDLFSADAIEQLQHAGCEVQYQVGLKGDALSERLRVEQPDVLVVRSTKVEAPQLEAAQPHLKMIVRAGSGVDTIKCDIAKQQGVSVCNCPGKNACAVAELTLALMLAIDRRIVENVTEFRAGHWNKGAFSECHGIKGTTLGLIGFGNIGREICSRALAFGMQVLVYDPFVNEEVIGGAGGHRCPALLDLAHEADVISVNVVGGKKTENLISGDFFAAMKPSAMLINTSRASVVNEAALVEAVHEKGIWVGLDVISGEPAEKRCEFHHPTLSNEPHILVTHHIGASTKQAEEAIGVEALRVVLHFQQDGTVLNRVNN